MIKNFQRNSDICINQPDCMHMVHMVTRAVENSLHYLDTYWLKISIQTLSSTLQLILVKYFSRLRDESCKVRRNTLLVLSHLVTNEMVKVKGQISEVALCIVDENEEIVGE